MYIIKYERELFLLPTPALYEWLENSHPPSQRSGAAAAANAGSAAVILLLNVCF